MSWVCKKCGQSFQQKPSAHTIPTGNPRNGYKEQPCKGQVVHRQQLYYSLHDAAEAVT